MVETWSFAAAPGLPGLSCFGERLDWRRACGLVSIGVGVALVNQS